MENLDRKLTWKKQIDQSSNDKTALIHAKNRNSESLNKNTAVLHTDIIRSRQ